MEPPPSRSGLQRQYAIGPGHVTSANQSEDLRVAQETALREARNMDNIMADYAAANPNRGGRRSRRNKRNKRTRKHKRNKRNKRNKRTRRR
jgi:hypothetical protein